MNLPNKISTLRIILIPFFVALFLLDGVFPYARTAATGVFIIAALTDSLDGYIARKYNLITNLGKFLDSIADKMLVTAALFLVAASAITKNAGINVDLYILICAIIIVLRELLVSALRQIMAINNIAMAADNFGRVKAAVQMIALPFLLACSDIDPLLRSAGLKFDLVMWLGFGLLVVATMLSILSAIHYLVKNKSALKES